MIFKQVQINGQTVRFLIIQFNESHLFAQSLKGQTVRFLIIQFNESHLFAQSLNVKQFFLDETDCISHSTNTLGKGMNPIILRPAMGK